VVPDAMRQGSVDSDGVPHAMEMIMRTIDTTADTTVYIALELSRATWGTVTSGLEIRLSRGA